MERKKHKRLNDTIMKPEDLKKSRVMAGGPSTSGSTSGGIKAKLDFRSTTGIPPKPTLNNTANPGVQSSLLVRPQLDDKWKEFGETIILNLETFDKSVEEAILAGNFNKIARMFCAALKSFMVAGDKMKMELRLMSTISLTVKVHGAKLNHVPLHRGLLHLLCHSKSFPENIQELLISIITSLAHQQPILDKCYIIAFLHDSIGMNVGLGTIARCSWAEKECSRELVDRILAPFGTFYPSPDMYPPCQIDNFQMADWLMGMREKFGRRSRDNGPRSEKDTIQLDVFVEFLKPWFETIRGEVLPKPLFRALCLLCGSEHVRQFISSRLEIWITLQKFHREISELLLILGTNINTQFFVSDQEVIDGLLKLNTKNMKTRTIVGPFNVALRRICEHPKNVEIVLEALFLNETGPPQNRSPTNLQTIFMILAANPTETTRALARITGKELFRERDISMKMLRAFLRELIRGYYHSKAGNGEFPFSVFADTMFREVTARRADVDIEIPYLVCELVSAMPLFTLSALLNCRENSNVFSMKYSNPMTSSSSEDVPPLMPPEVRLTRDKFRNEFIAYLENSIEFLMASRDMFSADDSKYLFNFSLLLFLEYGLQLDMGVVLSETEMTTCSRVFGECGVSEKMLMMLCRDSSQLSAKSTIDIISALTHRAATYHASTSTVTLISFSNPIQTIDAFLQVSIYPSKSGDSSLENARICSRHLYWTAWNTVLLWLTSSEPPVQFETIYAAFPVLRYMIQCLMTRKFEFPLDFEGKTAAEMGEEEAAMDDMENTVIQAIQKRGERVPIEAMVFPERCSFRAPPLLDELRQLGDRFKLASRLARCQTPPLLSQLIQTVGAQQSLYAIREMLSAEPATAKNLTSECLFHALMYYFDSHRIRDADQNSSIIVKALIRQAEHCLKSRDPIDDDYLLSSFISSLASPTVSLRTASVNTFSRLFPSSEDKAFDLVKLASCPRFDAKKLSYLETMASALLVETDVHLANSYLQFLTENCLESDDDHVLARAVCRTLSTDDCAPLHTSLCEYFVQYVEICMEMHKIQRADDVKMKTLDDSLCCMDIGQTTRIVLSRDVPVAVVKLLARYDTTQMEKGTKNESPFEMLVQFWLSPGKIPKIVDRQTGESHQFLSLAMRKEMLKSVEQRVVDAALEDLSESDAQEFVLVSQMSKETAEKVFRKAENMKITGIDRATLCNMYILIRGYRMTGVTSGESLTARLKQELDRLDDSISMISKEEEEEEEPMELVMEEQKKPVGFLHYVMMPHHETSAFAKGKTDKMEPADVSNWLKANCAAAAVVTNPKTKTSPILRLPAAFIQSAMNDEKCSLACLSHIEAHLKFFLSHETAFQTLSVIVDSAANKFDFVRKRFETFSSKILKSVSPPASVAGILQKHATNGTKASSRKGKSIEDQNPTTTTTTTTMKTSTFAEFAVAMKRISTSSSSSEKEKQEEKQLVDEFMDKFMEDKGEVVDSEDVNVFVRAILKSYPGADAEGTAEKCLSIEWSPQLRKIVCSTILEKHNASICPIFVFRLLSAYCKRFKKASFGEMFMTKMKKKNGEEKTSLVLNKKAFEVAVFYFCDVAAETDEYDAQIVSLICGLESEGGPEVGFQFARHLLQTSCANDTPVVRRTAQRLLGELSDTLLYINYKTGVASSLRILTNVESRDSCIRRCEQIVDRIVEIGLDPSAQLAEDICDEDKVKEETEKEKEGTTAISNEVSSKYNNNGKRGIMENRRGGGGGGGPLAKKGRFITAKDLPGPLSTGGKSTTDDGGAPGAPGAPGALPAEDGAPNDEPTTTTNAPAPKREWIETSHAMTRFVSLLREHPNIVKVKFPVLANYVSRVNAMSRKEMKEEKRINKVELVLHSIVTLCQHMKPEEMSSIDTALSNCLEFFEKHLEEGGYGGNEQQAFAELTIRACAEYLNHSVVEARTFLRENRQLIERVCKRCQDRYNVDLVLDNCQPSLI